MWGSGGFAGRGWDRVRVGGGVLHVWNPSMVMWVERGAVSEVQGCSGAGARWGPFEGAGRASGVTVANARGNRQTVGLRESEVRRRAMKQ